VKAFIRGMRMYRWFQGAGRCGGGWRILPLLAAVLLVASAVVLLSGCAARVPKIPAAVPVTPAEEDRREALLADARYGVENVPPGFPPQRAASFRVAAEGVRALKQERSQEAEDRLERALTLDPRNPFGYFYLAEIRLRDGAFLQALVFLNQAELLFQGHPYWLSEVYTNRGRCHEGLGSMEEALDAYTRALEYNPWNETAREGLARVRAPVG